MTAASIESLLNEGGSDSVDARSIVAVLHARAAITPDSLAFVLLEDGEERERLTFHALDQAARRVASLLVETVDTGSRALLLHRFGLEYVGAFFGCLYAGVVAVPAYRPSSRTVDRIAAILDDAEPAVALVDAGSEAHVAQLLGRTAASSQVPVVALHPSHVAAEASSMPHPQSLAFLQYTSGSTSRPKGVMVSHEGLLHNQQAIQHAIGHRPDESIVSWLPLHHDMGLIGNVIQAVFVGAPCYLMSPAEFGRDPLSWLRAISRYRAVSSGGPNFAYELCAHHASERRPSSLDLSSWRTAFNGSERVRGETLDLFTSEFAPHGFQAGAFYSCYGLAEGTLFVTGRRRPTRLPRTRATRSPEGGASADAAMEATDELVSSGSPGLDTSVVIVDHHARLAVPDGTVGEVWVAGPGVARGYWGKPEETENTFGAMLANGDGPYLRTGDLGLMQDGELYIVGRAKDMIIVRGVNHYPEDIERTVLSAHAVLHGAGAAFSVDVAGEERLVIAHEVRRHHTPGDLEEAMHGVRQAVVQAHEVHPYGVVLVPAGRIPRTTSGKVQRFRCRQLYLDGTLPAVTESRLPGPAGSRALEVVAADLVVLQRAPYEEALGLLWDYVRDLINHVSKVPIGDIDRSSNVTDLGLDSLAALELIGRIDADVQVLVPVEALLSGTTLGRLVEELLTAVRQQPAAVGGDRRRDRSDVAPLTPGQRRIWVVDQLTEHANPATIPIVLRLEGRLDRAALARSVQGVVVAHEALRVSILSCDAHVVQRVQPSVLSSLAFADLTPLTAVDRAARRDDLVRQLVNHRFDLSSPPLLFARLLRLAEDLHELHLTVHHIVCDGWALRILLRDLWRFYEEERSGFAAVEHGSTGYLESARLEHERLCSSELRGKLERWARALDRAPTLLELPRDRPRPPVKSYSSAQHRKALPDNTLTTLRELSRRHGGTLFGALFTGFAVLVQRQTGVDDVVIGTPFANRGRRDTVNQVGMFLNNVPLRVDLGGGPTFSEAWDRVKRRQLESLELGDVPLESIIDALDIRRDPSYTPLFQVFFNLLSFGSLGLQLDGLRVEAEPVFEGGANFDLSVYAVERQDELSLVFVYNADLFSPERIEELADQYVQLLGQAAIHPDTPITSYSLVTDRARRNLPCPDEALDPSWAGPVHEAVTRHAERSPATTALREEDDSWSWEELERRSNQLAHRLLSEGLRKGQLVAIHATRRASLVWAVLGILKAGGAFLILDGGHQAKRRGALARAVRPAALVALRSAGPLPEELRQALSEVRCGTIVDLPELADGASLNGFDSYPPGPPGVGVGAHDLACVVFTSGSTGTPKAVRGSHGGLSHFLPWQMEEFSLSPSDRFCLVSALAHDPIQRDIFTSIWAGGELLVPDGDRMLEPGWLAGWLSRHRITVVNLTPAMARLLALGPHDAPAPELPHLRLATFVGETLTDWDVRCMRALAPHATVVNLFGTTETQRALTHQAIDPGDHERQPTMATAVPIAARSKDVQVLVTNGSGGLAGIGELGELVVRSPHVALGYEGDESSSADRFHGEVGSNDRHYHTGDLGRFLPDGRITLVGRVDRQLNIRGYRVEAGEVEAAILEWSGAADAAVTALPSGDGSDRTLVAYVVPTGTSVDPGSVPAIDSHALRRHLAGLLTAPAVPAVIQVVESLPRDHNGKVDFDGLPPVSVPAGLPTSAAPRTDTERKLLRIWADVLRLPDMGIHDMFFELGGHSLLAAELVARVQEEFGVAVSLRSLFEQPTVAGMAVVVNELVARGELVRGLPLVAVDLSARYDPFPLNEIQQAYWIGRDPAFPINVPSQAYVEFDCVDLDVGRLERAWNALVRRHDMLRAVVSSDGLQRILPEVPYYEIASTDLSSLDAATREVRLLDIREQLAQRSSSGTEWPLFEVRASKLDDRTLRLHISVDFIVADASSWGVVGPEMAHLYENPDAELDPLDLSFRDYVFAELALQRTERFKESLDYWVRRLATLPPGPELPLAVNPETVTRPRFKRRQDRLSADQWTRIKTSAASHGLTPANVLLTAFSQIVAAWSKSPSFCLNLTLFNRLPMHPEVNSVLGDFTSLTLLEVTSQPNEPFVTLARRLQNQLMDDLDHRHVSGVRVLRELAKVRGRAAARMPVVFTSKLGIADLAGGSSPRFLGRRGFGISQTPQVWLDHQVSEDGSTGDLLFNWDVVEALFFDGVVDAMFTTYCSVLGGLATDDGRWQAANGPRLPPDQRHRREEVNATQGPVPEGLLHHPLRRQAEAAPNRLAVVTADAGVSYGALRDKSLKVASSLRERGVRPGELVPVLARKSTDQIVGVLGVLEAGAAYLPIDPDLPRERVQTLLRDTQARFALTHASTSAVLAGGSLEWVDLDDDGALATSASTDTTSLRPTDLAYVIFTSGSTGRPSGVMIDHRGALNTCVDVNTRFNIGGDDRVLGISALNFDLSVWDIFGVLGAGGTLVLPSPRSDRDPAHWLELMRRERVTVWNSVPALMQMLVHYVAARGEHLPASLRLVMLSGDWIPVDLPDQVRSVAPGVEVVSLGGATEASIWSVIYPIGQVDPNWPSIPYGKPMKNQTLHVLDQNLEPRPDWVPGDLFIGGVGVAKGYWDDAVKTCARFIEHPRTGERLYRTGDIARYLPSGDVEFLGRDDFQVKIQGHRVELGEIEALLVRHSAVRAAAVNTVGDPKASKRLVGYVVPAAGECAWDQAASGTQLAAELSDYLRRSLPSYMVPTTFQILPSLPLSPNGKVDRKALPPVSSDGERPVPVSHAPKSAVQRKILEIFRRVVGTESVDPHAEFSQLGATSIEMVQVHAELVAAIGLEFPVTLMFQYPTVAGLAGQLESRVGGRADENKILHEARRHAQARREALTRRARK